MENDEGWIGPGRHKEGDSRVTKRLVIMVIVIWVVVTIFVTWAANMTIDCLAAQSGEWIDRLAAC